MKADIGFIGLAVMGENLVLNMERNGYTVAVHNRSTDVLDSFINGRGHKKKFIRCATLSELTKALTPPRTVMMMIKAGEAVDTVIEQLLEHLESGDTIIDGGNSNFEDTERRMGYLKTKGLHFIGTGISGGEEGALNGPSLMPGGDKDAWPRVERLFQDISAKAPDGAPCCEWMGSGGAGHFVKMVHNGIEYGDMQIVSEIYWFMKEILSLSYDEMHSIFAQWNTGKLDSYLMKISSEILSHLDTDGFPLVEKILDSAGQKGTGKWTGIAALDEGAPLTLIVESVFARCLSSQKENRVVANSLYGKKEYSFSGDKTEIIAALHDALYAAKIVSYAQGFELLRLGSESHGWDLEFATIARVWRGGCIIRSVFLDKIAQAFAKDKWIPNLILSEYFCSELKAAEPLWRKVVTAAIAQKLPIPALSSALCWFDGYTSSVVPANMIQAQRDYFGAHTYERTDKPRGEFFHTDWTGHGGNTTSRTYSV